MALSLEELREFVDNLKLLRVGNGLAVQARRDKNNNAGIRLVLVDGLCTVETAEVVFHLDDPELTRIKIVERLAEEFAASWKEVFRKQALGPFWSDDGIPVKLVEEITLDGVVRI